MAPIAAALTRIEATAEGAIAQLGERVVRNDEVGGSIPPGSTTLRPSGYAWRSHARARRVKRGVRRSPQGEYGRFLENQHLIRTASGYAWRSRAEQLGVRRSPQGEDGP